MTDNNFVPETLTWCRQHYVPPVKEHINCPEFGKSDGTNGSCWWCIEMTPYQWHMCQDESWVRGLISPVARIRHKDREDAIKFIEEHKQKYPKGNERKSIISEEDRGTWEAIEEEAYWIQNMEESLKTGKPTKAVMPRCSQCKKTFGTVAFEYKYCPNCGAKMENC